MRILVLSDSHGDTYNITKAVKAQPEAEIIVHCGDGDEQVQFLKETYRDKMIVAVKGNCDLGSMLPVTETFSACGKKFFVTHGHMYNAKMGLYQLVCAAREQQADVLLFGHTHNALSTYDDGLTILNPGSCKGCYGTYGYVDITDKGDIVTNTVPIFKKQA